MTNALRNVLLIGSIAMFGGCVGMNTLTSTLEEAQGQRRGFVLRSGDISRGQRR